MEALKGLKVLDLSRILAGPWASQTLADLGADVIKVERPESGDDTRSWGPPWHGSGAPDSHDMSAYFSSANRNKRSLAVELGSPAGQAIILELVKKADVLIENFKVDGLKKFGLDYATLKKVNPRLIYCSITGFGQTGPYASWPGYDFLIQGMGGLMSVTGKPDTEPGGGPIKVGVALTDIMTGLYAVISVLAALSHRERTGSGQHIDVALLDVQIATLANQAANYLVGKEVPARMGNAHPNIVPYQDFTTADGHMIIAVGNDEQFKKLCSILGKDDWANKQEYSTNAERVINRDQLIPAIAEITRTASTEYWLTIMRRAGVPCGPINSIDSVFSDPQVKHKGMQLSLPSASGNHVSMVASPINLSETPVSYRYPPPGLGQHSREVLEHWLGMGPDTIELLSQKGVI